ncbi:MAG: FtsX-like permease family protein [Bacillota bacterium]
MSRSPRAPGLARLAALNLLRNPGRTLAVILGVLLVAGTTFAGGLITLGVRHAVAKGLDRLGADLMVVPRGSVEATHTALVMGEPVTFYMDGSVGRQVAAIDGVRAVSPQIYVETLASSACCTGRLMLVGYDPESDFTVKPWLRYALNRELEADEILVGNHVLGVTGDPLVFYGTTFRIAARLDPTGMGMDETVFLPQEAVWEMARNSVTQAEKPLTIPDGHISALLVDLDDPARAPAVAEQIEASLAGVSVLTAGQIAKGVSDDLGGLMGYLLPVVLGVLLVSLLLFIILFAAVAHERSREIGLLRAMGATANQAISVLLLEAALLGALGGAAGVLAGRVVYGLFKEAIMVSYTLPFLYPSAAEQTALGAAVVALSALGGGLAAAYPAMRLARLDPHYAIHAR